MQKDTKHFILPKCPNCWSYDISATVAGYHICNLCEHVFYLPSNPQTQQTQQQDHKDQKQDKNNPEKEK